MYVRWGEKQRYKTKVVESTPGEEAGIKSATVEVEGRYAYGYLSGEKGTHRIVRQSPFNSKGLRQVTSIFFFFERMMNLGAWKIFSSIFKWEIEQKILSIELLNSANQRKIF
jgi:protein subunit release factor B